MYNDENMLEASDLHCLNILNAVNRFEIREIQKSLNTFPLSQCLKKQYF